MWQISQYKHCPVNHEHISRVTKLLLRKNKVFDNNPSYKTRKNFKEKTEFTLEYLLTLLYQRNNIFLLPQNPSFYSNGNPDKIFPLFVSWRSMQTAVDIMLEFNIISVIWGSKKKYRKGWWLKSATEDSLFTTPGQTTEIRLNPRNEWWLIRPRPEQPNTIVKDTLNVWYEDNLTYELNDYLNRVVKLSYKNKSLYHKRVFHQDFTKGGRFYSEWQNIPRKFRNRFIHNDWVENDYNSSIPNILYLLETGKVFDGDIYSSVQKELDVDRPFLKICLLILLNTKNRTQASRAIVNQIFENGYYNKTDYKKVIEAFEKVHSSIKKYFYSDVGKYLIRIETRVVEKVIYKLMNRGIRFLPLHDAIYSHKKYKDTISNIMVDTLYEEMVKYQYCIRSILVYSINLLPTVITTQSFTSLYNGLHEITKPSVRMITRGPP